MRNTCTRPARCAPRVERAKSSRHRTLLVGPPGPLGQPVFAQRLGQRPNPGGTASSHRCDRPELLLRLLDTSTRPVSVPNPAGEPQPGAEFASPDWRLIGNGRGDVSPRLPGRVREALTESAAPERGAVEISAPGCGSGGGFAR